MFDNNSVPTRIVVNGTATMKLSDRFKHINSVKPVKAVVPVTNGGHIFDNYYEPLPRSERPTRLYVNPIHRRFGGNHRRMAPRYERAVEPQYEHQALVQQEEEYDEYFAPSPTIRHRQLQRLSIPSIPIQNRISFKREHRMAHRFTFPNTNNNFRPNHFLPMFPPRRQRWQGRGGGFWNRGRGGRNHWGGQQNGRKKLTLEELDRELEQYMRSGKHPRINV